MGEGQNQTYKTQIYISQYKYGQWTARKFGSGIGNDTSPRWSPCKTEVAFLSDRDGDKKQIFILPLDDGEAIRVTLMKKGVHNLVWSPDSKAFVFVSSRKPDSEFSAIKDL